MIQMVRVWHDHCIQRMRCPWTVQVQLTDRLMQFECHQFLLAYGPGESMTMVTDLIDPPTLEMHGVIRVRIVRWPGDPWVIVAGV